MDPRGKFANRRRILAETSTLSGLRLNSPRMKKLAVYDDDKKAAVDRQVARGRDMMGEFANDLCESCLGEK